MREFFIAPNINNDSKLFWDACMGQELKIPQCNTCNSLFWPASAFCPKCHSSDIHMSSVSGRGRVYSYVVFRREFNPQMQNSLPYVVAVIALDEGVKIISNVINCKIENVFIEMPVQLTWKCKGDLCIPQFEPYKEES